MGVPKPSGKTCPRCEPQLAQRTAVADYLNGGAWELVAEFTEVESGKRNDRPELAKALEACQATRLGPAAHDYDLNYERSFPSTTSWESGDRRVDCYVTTPGGNVINASVLP